MKKYFSLGARLSTMLFLTALPNFSQALRQNYDYVCNKERIVVGRCRRDSDDPTQPRTKDEDNYCSVYYPDRPKRNGFEVQTVELRGDIIKKLEACGAFQEKQTPLPQVSSKPPANSKPVDATATPKIAAANSVAIEHYEKAKQFYKAGNYAKTIPEVEQAIALNLDKDRLAVAYLFLCDSYNSTRQYAKTISLMPQAIVLNNNPPFYSILGNAYERTLQFPKALAAFKEAVRLDPKQPLYLSALGNDYVLNNRTVEAKKVYDTLLAIDPNEAKYLLDNIELGNEKGPVGLLVKFAQLGLIGRDTDEALEWFRNAFRLNPTNKDLLFDIGSGLDICGKYEEALAVYRRLLAMKLTPKDLGTTHYFIGQTYNNMKEFPQALPELTEANGLNPSYYTKNEIGITYLNLKQYPKALTAFQEAIKLKPSEGNAHLMIGRTYAEMNQPENAVAAYTELVRLEPKSARGHVEIGALNFGLKKYPDAGRAYSNALRIDPKNKSAILGIGRTYLAVGRKPEALRAYNELKPLDADLAQQLLNEINKH